MIHFIIKSSFASNRLVSYFIFGWLPDKQELFNSRQNARFPAHRQIDFIAIDFAYPIHFGSVSSFQVRRNNGCRKLPAKLPQATLQTFKIYLQFCTINL